MSRPLRSFGLLVGAAAIIAMCTPSEATACGGGTFYTETQVSAGEDIATTGHRVVISMSKTQTILWDQIVFKGKPEDFAWVYPVKDGAKLEVATDSWLETLDAQTSKVVYSPTVTCTEEGGYSPSSDSGCNLGCGAGSDGGAKNGGGDFGVGGETENPVDILQSETVGPYDVKTITSDVPGAIGDWLTTNGYNVPADASPILDAYAAEGYNFIAMRLTPGAGVSMMKPVRVVTPGPTATFPMRMLAVGAAEKVALNIFVLTEGSVRVASHENAYIDPSEVVWDWNKGGSNYAELRDTALSANGGSVFLTSYSMHDELFSDTIIDHSDEPVTKPAIARDYLLSAVKNAEAQDCAPDSVVSLVAPGSAGESATVVDVCDDQGNCTEAGAGELDSRDLACGAADDLAQALVGMHPKDVWLTRLEANLPKSALDKDLVIEPAPDQQAVTADVAADSSTGDACATGPGLEPQGPSRPQLPHGALPLLFASMALASAAGRRLTARRPKLA